MQKERVDVYTIPPNFAQEGTILNGRIGIRNAVESGILVLFLMQILLSLDWGVRAKIYAGIIVILPTFIFALLGVQGESLTSFVYQFFKYLANRRVITVPDGKYRLKRNRRLRKQQYRQQKLQRRQEQKKGVNDNRTGSKGAETEAQGSETSREAESESRKKASERSMEK